MKQLICELCGSNDLVKTEGLYVCQNCGTKYTAEEARKLIIDGPVEVHGTVQVDRGAELDNRMKNAIGEYEAQNFDRAASLFTELLNIDPQNPKAIIYKASADCWSSTLDNNQMPRTANEIVRALEIAAEKGTDSFEECIELASNNILILNSAMKSLLNSRVGDMQTQVRDLRSDAATWQQNAKQYLWHGPMDMVGPAKQRAAQSEYQANQLDNNINHLIENYLETAYNSLIIVGRGIMNKASAMDKVPQNANEQVQLLNREINSDLLPQANNVTKMAAQAYKNDIASFTRMQEDQKNEAIRIYWQNHPEEKTAIESRLEELKNEFSILSKGLKDKNDQLKMIDEGIKKKADEEVALLRDPIQKKIQAAQCALDSLGVFKMKEKKALRETIEDLEGSLPKKSDIDTILNKIRNERASEIREIKKSISILNEKIAANQNEAKQLNTELNKSR